MAVGRLVGAEVALGSGVGVVVELDAAGAHALAATASKTSSVAMEIAVDTRRTPQRLQWAENKRCADMVD